MKYGRTLLATIAVLMIVLSTIPRFSLATPYVYDAKIDKNLWLEEGNSYKVLVRIDWNPDLEPIKFNHDAVINELKREAAETQEPIITHLKQRGAKILNTFWLTNLILIEADANTIQELATLPTVTKIIANFKVTVPKSEIGANTEFTVSGNSSSWNLGKVRAPEVWEKLGVTGRNVRVATTDTGVDISHPDIAGTLWTDDPTDPTYPGGWIEFDEYGNIVPESVPHDTETHGTETYGLILGQTTGMAPDAKGMHALVTPNLIGTLSQVIAGLEWVLVPFDQNGNSAGARANVSCHSWGPLGGYREELIQPIREMWYSGHFVVAMIGNEGEGTSRSPGDVYECIAVGATDANDYVDVDSSGRVIYKTEWQWGVPPNWPDQWVKPDLSAPGVNVVVPLPGNQYGQHTGTSFAAPHVAGAAVLMLSANPELAVQDIEDILKETAVWYDRYSSERPDIRYGWGRIDAFKAVLFAGFKVTLVIPTGNVNGVYEIANAVKEELAKVRVHVEIEERSASEIADTVWETGLGGSKPWEAPGEGWDMAWYEFSGGPEDLMSYYLANATRYLGNNIMPWLNKRADELLIGGMNCIKAKTRQRYLWVWQEEFMHDPPCVIIYYPSDSMCARGIAFNLNHPVLSNRYVRLAIAHAIPYGEISKILSDHEIEVAGRIGWGVPIHPCTNYTDPDGVTVRLFNMKLDPYEYNLAKAQMYLDMWFYSQTGTDYTKGPVGDANFDGKVNLDDLFLLIDKWGETPPYPIDWWPPEGWKGPEVYPWPVTEGASVAPGNDIDIDFDNDGDTADPDDFLWWLANWGKEYPFPGASPVEPLGSVEYPAIYVEPAAIEDKTYKPGTNFTVSIWTNYTGSDVWGYEFTLSWNPFILNCTEVVNGNLIVNDTYTATFRAGKIDNNAGKLHLSGCYFDVEVGEPVSTTSGPGILANVTFTVVGYGDSGILFGDETRLIGVTEAGSGTEYHIVDAFTMPDHIQNGYLCNVKPQPTHDLAVTTVTTYPATVRVGEFVNVTVDVENQGMATEMFEVKVYFDYIHPNWLIGTETGIILDAKRSVSLTFTWDTAGVRAGNHTIKAVASTVMGETETDDNTYTDGVVEVYWVHDVAVTNVTYELPYGANATYPGWTINITATVQNEGDYTETFDVTAYYDSAAIGNQTVSLNPGATETLIFVWDTTGVSPGNAGLDYTISAEASVVPGETDTADNTYIDGTVRVKYPGDVDGDGDVDPTDHWLFGGAYGSHYGNPSYDWRCDFDGDGYVGPYDHWIFSGNYGHKP